MKTLSKVIGQVILGALFVSGCGTSAKNNGSTVKNFADESVEVAPYSAVATDAFSNRSFVQTGRTEIEAIQKALDLCNARTSTGGLGTCTVKSIFSNSSAPVLNGDVPSSFVCFISENNTNGLDRTWVGVGATVNLARQAAEDKCAFQAGTNCQVTACQNADYGKTPAQVQ